MCVHACVYTHTHTHTQNVQIKSSYLLIVRAHTMDPVSELYLLMHNYIKSNIF